MKKRLYAKIFLFSAVFLFTGCGRKKVEQTNDNIASSGDANTSAITTSGNYNSVYEQIGIDENYTWKDKVVTIDNDTCTIKAIVNVPNAHTVQTSSFEEKYYTNEDKKYIIEKLFDKDTVRKDVENPNFECREHYEELIEIYTNAIENVRSDNDFSAEEKEEYIKKYNSEIEAAREKSVNAPLLSDISPDVEDYSCNYYEGSMKGKDYYISFYADKEKKMSGFDMIAKRPEEFIETDLKYPFATNSIYGERENRCKLKEDEAKDMADNIISKLGIDGLEVLSVNYLRWKDAYAANDEVNGYEIIYARQIGEIPVKPIRFFSSRMSDETYEAIDGYHSYGYELFKVDIVDDGILRISYESPMEQTGSTEAIKLLDFEQIEAAVKEKLANSFFIKNINYVDFMYLMVLNEEKDSYIYVPVWVVSGLNFYGNSNENIFEDIYPVDSFILVNAIDGTIMELDYYNCYDLKIDFLPSTIYNRDGSGVKYD